MTNFYDRYEFFPLTILDTPIEAAKEQVEMIINKWWGKTRIAFGTVDLNKINPPPHITSGGTHFIKILIWEPKNNPNITALFVNLEDAYHSLIHVWNDRFAKKTLTLRLSNDNISPYPHHEINVKTADKDERVVYTHFESKWKFFQTGPMQGFENPDHYKSKSIKARLDNKIVNEYMRKLGLEVWSEDFYQSNKEAVYFEQLAWKE